MRSRRLLLSALLMAGLVLAGTAPSALAAPSDYADPRAPRCTSTAGTVPQAVTVGELTTLTTRCTSPSGAALTATALQGDVALLFGSLYYRADDAGPGYDKITVSLAETGPGGPSASFVVTLHDR